MKYVGSKQKLSKHIVPIIQNLIDLNNIAIYIEPFVGGANVIDKIKCNSRLGIDLDNLPITLFNHYLSKSIGEQLPEVLEKEHYYYVRDNPQEFDETYRAAILLFGSYNARVYGGCWGAYAHTKDGFRNYFQEAKRNFEKQLPNLKGIKFLQHNFFDLVGELTFDNTLLYLDPPYKSGIGYSDEFNHDIFWEKVGELSKNNIVLVSEYEAPEDFEVVWSMEVKTHMNNRGKLPKVEKLFRLREIE